MSAEASAQQQHPALGFHDQLHGFAVGLRQRHGGGGFDRGGGRPNICFLDAASAGGGASRPLRLHHHQRRAQSGFDFFEQALLEGGEAVEAQLGDHADHAGIADPGATRQCGGRAQAGDGIVAQQDLGYLGFGRRQCQAALSEQIPNRESSVHGWFVAGATHPAAPLLTAELHTALEHAILKDY